MAGPNVTLSKEFVSGAAIAKNTIVMFSADDTVVVATANTSLPVGIAETAAAAAGDRVEVCLAGIAEVKAAGAITRGDYVVATTGGEAVAGTASTAKQQAVGIAMVGVADDDIFPCLIARSQFDLA